MFSRSAPVIAHSIFDKEKNTIDISEFFKSIVDQDTAEIVICDTQHTIIYMNDAACKQYSKRGGSALVGKNLLDCHNQKSTEMIGRVVAWFGASGENNIVHTFYNEKENKDVYMIALRSQQGDLIGYYEKHAYRDRDTQPFYGI